MMRATQAGFVKFAGAVLTDGRYTPYDFDRRICGVSDFAVKGDLGTIYACEVSWTCYEKA